MKKKLKNNKAMLKNIIYLIGMIFLLQSCSQTDSSSEYSHDDHKHDTTGMKDEYVCPMFCDSTVHDKPGVCKVCGMDFEKVKTGKKVYYCPMHPEIIRDQPGQCPICGMDLVERIENATGSGKLGLGAIVKPVNEAVLASIKTVRPEKKDLELVIDAMGYIAYNPKNTKSISIRYSGRIEKLYIKYNYQSIKKGQKIMEIYSPDLITAQQNYLFVLMNDFSATELVYAAKQKLRLLGMEESQLEILAKTHKVENTMSIYSPYEGHIHEMNNLTEVSMPTMEMNGAGADMNKSTEQKEFSIREGMYVQKGQTIFDVINTSNPWAILKIYPEYIKDVKLNQPVEISVESTPHIHYQYKVNYIESAFEKDSKYMHIRVYMENSDHHALKIGSLIKAKISTGIHSGLWIPRQATLDLGDGRYAVFVKKENVFYVKEIKVGIRIDNRIQIIEGITDTDEIAVDAQYLIDSEGFIQPQ
jgi:Cu(I)/Ag(I) efflux system membrane fusion protein